MVTGTSPCLFAPVRKLPDSKKSAFVGHPQQKDALGIKKIREKETWTYKTVVGEFPPSKRMHCYTSTSICENVRFTSRTAEKAMQDRIKTAHFIDICGSDQAGNNLQISTIWNLCETIDSFIENHPHSTIVICPEHATSKSLSDACLLFGAYLILCRGVELDDLLDGMKDILEGIDQEPLSSSAELHPNVCVIDFWNSLLQAKKLKWLGKMITDDAEPLLDVEMAGHYALPINGNLHVLIPDKLLVLLSLASLPDERDWADHGDGRRHFSARFLAALLADLGVSAVACLGRAGDGDAAAFRAHGLDVHELGLDPRRPALLPALDRLLAVSRAAPGAVALYGGDAAGAGCVATVVAAWLMRECGFGEGAASAWVRMGS